MKISKKSLRALALVGVVAVGCNNADTIKSIKATIRNNKLLAEIGNSLGFNLKEVYETQDNIKEFMNTYKAIDGTYYSIVKDSNGNFALAHINGNNQEILCMLEEMTSITGFERLPNDEFCITGLNNHELMKATYSKDKGLNFKKLGSNVLACCPTAQGDFNLRKTSKGLVVVNDTIKKNISANIDNSRIYSFDRGDSINFLAVKDDTITALTINKESLTTTTHKEVPNTFTNLDVVCKVGQNVIIMDTVDNKITATILDNALNLVKTHSFGESQGVKANCVIGDLIFGSKDGKGFIGKFVKTPLEDFLQKEVDDYKSYDYGTETSLIHKIKTSNRQDKDLLLEKVLDVRKTFLTKIDKVEQEALNTHDRDTIEEFISLMEKLNKHSTEYKERAVALMNLQAIINLENILDGSGKIEDAEKELDNIFEEDLEIYKKLIEVYKKLPAIQNTNYNLDLMSFLKEFSSIPLKEKDFYSNSLDDKLSETLNRIDEYSERLVCKAENCKTNEAIQIAKKYVIALDDSNPNKKDRIERLKKLGAEIEVLSKEIEEQTKIYNEALESVITAEKTRLNKDIALAKSKVQLCADKEKKQALMNRLEAIKSLETLFEEISSKNINAIKKSDLEVLNTLIKQIPSTERKALLKAITRIKDFNLNDNDLITKIAILKDIVNDCGNRKDMVKFINTVSNVDKSVKAFKAEPTNRNYNNVKQQLLQAQKIKGSRELLDSLTKLRYQYVDRLLDSLESEYDYYKAKDTNKIIMELDNNEKLLNRYNSIVAYQLKFEEAQKLLNKANKSLDKQDFKKFKEVYNNLKDREKETLRPKMERVQTKINSNAQYKAQLDKTIKAVYKAETSPSIDILDKAVSEVNKLKEDDKDNFLTRLERVRKILDKRYQDKLEDTLKEIELYRCGKPNKALEKINTLKRKDKDSLLREIKEIDKNNKYLQEVEKAVSNAEKQLTKVSVAEAQVLVDRVEHQLKKIEFNKRLDKVSDQIRLIKKIKFSLNKKDYSLKPEIQSLIAKVKDKDRKLALENELDSIKKLTEIKEPKNNPLRDVTTGGGFGGFFKRESKLSDIIGIDNTDTCLQVAKQIIGNKKTNKIIIASNEDFADALSGSPLASKLNTALLFIDDLNKNKVMDFIKQKVNKNGEVIILGGYGVIDHDIEDSLAENFKVTRYGGKDRYETNQLVNKAIKNYDRDTVYLASGIDFADSVSVTPRVTKDNSLLLLTTNNSLSESTRRQLLTIRPRKVILVGGESVINKKVEDQIRNMNIRVERVAGLNRYETSYKINSINTNKDKLAVTTTGKDYRVSLLASVLASVKNTGFIISDKGNTEYLDKYKNENKATIINVK